MNEKFDFVEIHFPEVLKLKIGNQFKTTDLSNKKEKYRVGAKGLLSKAVYRKIEKTKEEILSDYSDKVLEYQASENKHLLEHPKREKFRYEFLKWTKADYTGDLNLFCSGPEFSCQIYLDIIDGRVAPLFEPKIKFVDMKPKKKPKKKLQVLKDHILILKNNKPIAKILFFKKSFMKQMEKILKSNKIKYRWNKKNE